MDSKTRYQKTENAPGLKYLDISSEFRDRNIYANQANFVIPISQSHASQSGLTSKSGVSLAVPYESGTTQAQTQTTVTLPTSSSTIYNYYIGSVINLPNDASVGIAGTNEFVVITAYNALTKVATVSFSVAPAAAGAQYYTIRKQAPSFQGIAQAGSTTSSVVFPATASTVTDYYKGHYLGFTTNATIVTTASLRGVVRLITAYDGSTRTATTLPFPAATATNSFDVDQFSYDSYFPLKYTGSQVSSSQVICYEMILEQLILPNQLVGSSTNINAGNIGGRLNNYPFVYVDIYSETSRASDQILYSNNPNSTLATFKCPIVYTFPISTVDSNSRVADSGYLDMPFLVLSDLSGKTIKFKPNDNLHFSVRLPDGSYLTYITADNVPPLFANPSVQINALISMKRLD